MLTAAAATSRLFFKAPSFASAESESPREQVRSERLVDQKKSHPSLEDSVSPPHSVVDLSHLSALFTFPLRLGASPLSPSYSSISFSICDPNKSRV